MENIEAMLCAYVEGDLDAAGKSRIEKHLQDNPQHKKLLDELVSMRELVRALPRAEAPIDLEESLRQKVERSMLLEGSVAAAPQRQRMDWWPQFFTIAAIFLLFASLCFILCKTLLPTLKPAVFTQNSVDNSGSIPPANQRLDAEAAPTISAPKPAPAQHSAAEQNDTIAQAGAILQPAHQLTAQSAQQVLSAAQVDLQSIRRRLQNSGYGVSNSAPGGQSQPVLMVVNSTDPPATNVEITQFLSNNSGISWKAVPSDSETKPVATTLPSSTTINYQASHAAQTPLEKSALPTVAPATQPSTDLYVARGITPQQADALRLSLIVPQNGPSVQVTLQSAQPLATTQPSTLITKDDGAAWLKDLANAPPTTQSADSANTATELNAAPTTVSSATGEAATARESTGMPLENGNAAWTMTPNKSQVLLPVDAVIVLQTGTVITNPTTMPAIPAEPSPTAIPAAPSTQP